MTVHHLPIQPRDWRERALCARPGIANLFHPEKGQPAAPAKRICAACPVRAECLDFALSHPASVDRYGIYGGLSEKERRRVRRDAA